MVFLFATPVAIGRTPHRPTHLCVTPVSARQNAPAPQQPPRRVRRRKRGGENLVTRARRIARRGDRDKALEILRTHVTEVPSNARAWLALAQLEYRNEAALKVFADGAAHCPTSIHLLHAWAVRAGRSGAIHESRRLFRACLRMAPNDGVVWQAYAILEEKSHDIALARALFAAGAERCPMSVDLWCARGALERRAGCHEDAVRYLKAAAAVLPTHAPSLLMWALSLEKIDDFVGSKQVFERAILANPRSVPCLQAFALFNSRRGDVERARELFTAAAEINPKHAPVWHAWATMEKTQGNTGRARELFDIGVEADPQSVPMLSSWATMELELGHIDADRTWSAGNRRHRQGVGEKLHMLRLLLDRRSSEDVSTVMQWLDRRSKEDRDLYDTITERKDSDTRLVRDWIARRSQEDIDAFTNWVGDRYERDRQIGTYIFNWDIPKLDKTRSAPVKVKGAGMPVSAVPVPQEWYMMEIVPEESLQAADERYWYNESPVDYAEGVYFMGQIAHSVANRAALVFALGTISLALVGISAELDHLGYSPAGVEQTEEDDITPPTGVDAYLYDTLDEDALSTAGGTISKIRK